MTTVRSDYYDKEDLSPVSLILDDGTTVFTEGVLADIGLEPYVVDHDGRNAYLLDNDAPLARVSYWEKPAYYAKTTAKGRPMWQVVSARPQRLTIHPHQYCDFWKKPGQGCRFCVMATNYKAYGKEARLLVEDIIETVGEAVKEPGGYQSVFLTGGTILSGATPLDDELELYLAILKGIGPLFGGQKFPSQLISTAFSLPQLARLKAETGLTSYTADLEVLDAELFKWICPGKSRLIGYEGWKDRLAAAVGLFGRGRVNTGIVAGVELAKPKGFKSEEEALNATLKEARSLAERGVFVVSCVWRVMTGSVFARQRPPSLEYYVRLALGLDAIRREYGFLADMDNYRRCGNHADTDLARI
jgi:biotin synthase-related radical SAM superfamily protein